MKKMTHKPDELDRQKEHGKAENRYDENDGHRRLPIGLFVGQFDGCNKNQFACQINRAKCVFLRFLCLEEVLLK